MDDQEIAKSAALEQRHWWYAERRALVRRTAARWAPGKALDVGCAGGGNTSVLRDLGWSVSYAVAPGCWMSMTKATRA